MRILVIAHTLDPRSGWGRYAVNVINELRAQGSEVQVFVPEPFESRQPVGSAVTFFRNLLAARRFGKARDVVHAFDCWPFAVYGWAAVIGTKKRLFVTGVGTYSVAPLGQFKRYILLPALRRASKIFCVSRYTQKRMLEKASLSNTTVIFWGHSELPSLSVQEFGELDSHFALPDHEPLVLTVGQIKRRKGQLDTLEAVALLRNKYPRIGYVMVGSDGDKSYVSAIRSLAKREGIENSVRIISAVTEDRALSYFYMKANIFAMNSNNDGEHFEGFGLVFLEAGQFGKPQIGSRGCGIEEAIEEGYSGFLAKQGDAQDIAEKIDTLLQADMALLGKQAREFSSRFTWQKAVGEYMRHYANA